MNLKQQRSLQDPGNMRQAVHAAYNYQYTQGHDYASIMKYILKEIESVKVDRSKETTRCEIKLIITNKILTQKVRLDVV